MTIDETTALLVKEQQKTYTIPIPQDDENNNLSNTNDNMDDNGVLREYDKYAMTKDELNKYIDDPWWIQLRYRCSAFCWITCLMALAVSLYIMVDALQHDPCRLTLATDNDANHTQAIASPLATEGSSATPTSVVVALLTQQTT